MIQINQQSNQNFESDQNEFLMQYLQYESCPFCSRSFFRGKLAYHLKHCSNQNPMSKTNKTTPRHQKNSLSSANNYEVCLVCSCRIPGHLFQKHSSVCEKIHEGKRKKSHEPKIENANEEIRVKSMLPKIGNYASQEKSKGVRKSLLVANEPMIIKVRQQLRCLKIAQKVQQIQCQHCGRKFSKQASQRHIPICSLLHQKEKRKMTNERQSKKILKREKMRMVGVGRSVELVERKKQKQLKQRSQVDEKGVQKQKQEKQRKKSQIENPQNQQLTQENKIKVEQN